MSATPDPQDRQPHDSQKSGQEADQAPLIEHLIELRSRLVVIMGFLLVGFIGCFIFSETFLRNMP